MGRQQILRPFAASILSKPFINGEIDQQRLVGKFVGEKVSNDDDRHVRMSQKLIDRFPQNSENGKTHLLLNVILFH